MHSSELNIGSEPPFFPSVEVSKHGACKSLIRVDSGGVEDEGGDNVRVNVRGGSSVLNVALTVIGSDLSGDSEGSSSVSNTEREGLDGRSFVVTSESLLVVITVSITMNFMVFGESLHHVEDVLHTSRSISHDLSGVVGVATRSVPVGEELGSVGNTHTIVFSDSGEEVARHQKLISYSNTSAGTNLVFPLSRHDFSVSARNSDSSEEAGLVVDVSNATTEGSVGTNRAVVGSLSSRVSVVGPSEGVTSELGGSSNKSVLLFNSVPGLLSEV